MSPGDAPAALRPSTSQESFSDSGTSGVDTRRTRGRAVRARHLDTRFHRQALARGEHVELRIVDGAREREHAAIDGELLPIALVGALGCADRSRRAQRRADLAHDAQVAHEARVEAAALEPEAIVERRRQVEANRLLRFRFRGRAARRAPRRCRPTARAAPRRARRSIRRRPRTSRTTDDALRAASSFASPLAATKRVGSCVTGHLVDLHADRAPMRRKSIEPPALIDPPSSAAPDPQYALARSGTCHGVRAESSSITSVFPSTCAAASRLGRSRSRSAARAT